MTPYFDVYNVHRLSYPSIQERWETANRGLWDFFFYLFIFFK